METMEWLGEFNIQEWDGVIDRVQAVKVWNQKTLVNDVRIRYPDGTVFQVEMAHFEEIVRKEVHA